MENLEGRVNSEHRDGLILLILGGLMLISTGTVLSVSSTVDMIDYRAMYFPARSLMQGHNPYNETAVFNLAKAEGGVRPSDTDRANNHFARYLYLPTAFTITCPFAILPWELSRMLWMSLIGAGFVFAAYLMWDGGKAYSPLLAGALLGFFLANNELLMVVGNVAALAIILCVTATWSFIHGRYIALGILSLAVSLMLKPHDSGLVWLYFILAGRMQRRRAIQVLLVTAVLSAPAFIWTSVVAPTWMHDLRANLALDSVHAERSDPAIASMGSHGLSMMVNLQTVFGSFWRDPLVYNTATYLVIGPLILIWIISTLRSDHSLMKSWYGLASAAALTMLPFYHRQYDTKLLLLTVPACCILWIEGGSIRWIGLILNVGALTLTGDLSWLSLLAALNFLPLRQPGLTESILKNAQIFCAPVSLLVIGTFYLCVYVRRDNAIPRVNTSSRSDCN